MRKLFSYLHLPYLLFVGISAIFFFNFTAEDAYITYRYAENWVNTGSLVFNAGEPINAMTSPLHAVLSAVLFYLTGQTVLGNKILSILLLVVTVLLVWHRYRDQLPWQSLALILVCPPCILLWTFGGLETPILLFLATVTVILTSRSTVFSLRTLVVIYFLAGLAFLTRYDSILFFLPIALYGAWKARSIKHVMIAVAGAVILPAIWFYISVSYYGDLLPTSFYVKTPKAGFWDLFFNGRYIAFYLFYIGILPVLSLALILLAPKHKTIDTLYRHILSAWWLYAGIAAEILYGLTMATHHMMFSFRFFVPYIPSTVILSVDLFRRATESRQIDLKAGRPAYFFTGFVVCLMLFQFYQTIYTYNHSVNGISLIGEYRDLGVRDYVSFLQILKKEANDIQAHWETVHRDKDRRPRIITYAAGMLPYTYKESYIYEKLVSYRHCHERYRQGMYADYLHILAPRQGQIAQQLPMSEDRYDLVSSYEMFFDGSMQEFLVYYNPKPKEHNLSATINEPCELDKSAGN